MFNPVSLWIATHPQTRGSFDYSRDSEQENISEKKTESLDAVYTGCPKNVLIEQKRNQN